MQQIQRAAQILDFLANSYKEDAGIDIISSSTGLSASTVHRYLKSLKEVDFVQQNPVTTKYSLGYKLAELGVAVLNRFDLRTIAMPFMAQLREITRETVCLIIRVNKLHRMYVEILESNLTVKAKPPLAVPIPLYIGAPGRVLSAWLSDGELQELVKIAKAQPETTKIPFNEELFYKKLQQIRQDGYGTGGGELMADISSIAAPVRNHFGIVVAALSITGPLDRFTSHQMDIVMPDLLEAAGKISKALGYKNAD